MTAKEALKLKDEIQLGKVVRVDHPRRVGELCDAYVAAICCARSR
jgi:hypothetical protein